MQCPQLADAQTQGRCIDCLSCLEPASKEPNKEDLTTERITRHCRTARNMNVIKIKLIWILLLGIVEGAAHSPAARKRGGRHDFPGTHKKPASASTSGAPSTRCNGVHVIPNHRRACSFYIWDGPSALFYKWCHHLLKDNLYEGKGGHMVGLYFVVVET